MKQVEPEVHVVARTIPDFGEMEEYLESVGGKSWLLQHADREESLEEIQVIPEFAGRLCYRSWAPGLNPNVVQVRQDQAAYLNNILAQRHGSVLEHVSYSFVFQDVSRVLTHELCRHRPGVAISQESMRFVRLTEVPFWFPGWVQGDPELVERATDILELLESFQLWMAQHFGLDEKGVPFAEKKARTSFMRRFAPDGVATSVMWTCNLRELRHVIEVRTSPGAEEEIRLVFGKVARIMRTELPDIFGDFEHDKETGAWVPEHSKV